MSTKLLPNSTYRMGNCTVNENLLMVQEIERKSTSTAIIRLVVTSTKVVGNKILLMIIFKKSVATAQ